MMHTSTVQICQNIQNTKRLPFGEEIKDAILICGHLKKTNMSTKFGVCERNYRVSAYSCKY